MKLPVFLLLLLAGFAAIGSLWIAHRRSVAEAKSTPVVRKGGIAPAGLERDMLTLVNADRASPKYLAETHGQSRPLVWDAALAAVARAHSCDMMKRGYFAHESPEGVSPRHRIDKAGIRWRMFAENIAKDQAVADAEAAFMREPPFQENHRANILNSELTDIGIGVCSDREYLYITQDFRTR